MDAWWCRSLDHGTTTPFSSFRRWPPAANCARCAGTRESVSAVAISRDGRVVAAAGLENHNIRLWDVATGRETLTLRGHANWISALALSPDGRILASASTDGTHKLWDVTNGRELHTLKHELGYFKFVSFSPDGRLLASHYAGQVRLWDVANGREVRSLEHTGAHYSTFSGDGRLLASASYDQTLKLWDVTSGRELRTLSGHAGGVTYAAFTPDGRLLASSSEDGTLRLWDVTSGRELAGIASFEDGEWITITEQGYFDASSPKAAQYLNVRIGNQVVGADQYYERFYRPDIVKLALAGRPLAGLTDIASVKSAPAVTIVDTPASTLNEQIMVTLKVMDAGGGIGDVRLYLNGTAVVLEKTRTLRVAATSAKSQTSALQGQPCQWQEPTPGNRLQRRQLHAERGRPARNHRQLRLHPQAGAARAGGRHRQIREPQAGTEIRGGRRRTVCHCARRQGQGGCSKR